MILFKYIQGSPKRWLVLACFMLAQALLIYPALHELGHALVVRLLGGEITYLGLTAFNACVAYIIDTTPIGYACIDVAGVLFPLLVWLLILATMSKRDGFLAQMLKFSISISIIISLVPWIIIPLLSYTITVPTVDDINHFISHSGWEPEMVTFLFSGILVSCLTLFQKVIKDIEKSRHKITQ